MVSDMDISLNEQVFHLEKERGEERALSCDTITQACTCMYHSEQIFCNQ